jgi:carbon monoxide dehydrogenase subunit G
MARVELSTVIDASPRAVWDLTTDFRRIPELAPDTAVDVSYVSEGEVGVDTVFRETDRLGPMRSETEWRVTEFDPPHRHVHVGSMGPMKIVVTTEIEPTGQGSLLRHTLDTHMRPFLRPLGLLAERMFLRRQLESTLNSTHTNVKRILEGEPDDVEEEKRP